MNKVTSILKKVLKFILILLLVVVLFVVVVLVYNYFFYPDIFKTFDEYQGITFDYTLEEDAYKDKLYYKQLSEEEALYYRCMYHAASNLEHIYYLENVINSDDEYRARNAFGYDFPEYFWFGDDVIFKNEIVKDKLGLMPFYYYSVSQNSFDLKDENIKDVYNEINDKVDSIIDDLKCDDDYNTILNVYKYVIDNAEYNVDFIDYQDLRSVFLDGEGVCSSYAETFQLLCNRLGYECYSVYGDSIDINYSIIDYDEDNNTLNETDEKHEWNIIRIGDNWYWVDPTWGDAQYQSDDPYLNLEYEMSYFLIPDNLMFMNHKCNDLFTYPICNDYSYYLYDDIGVVVDDYDINIIEDSLTNAFNNGRHNIIYQFTNEQDLKEFVDWANDGTNFYRVYQTRIYPYYNGVMNYWIKNNYSVILFWYVSNYY